jgi:hypothetical protein
MQKTAINYLQQQVRASERWSGMWAKQLSAIMYGDVRWQI